MLGLHSSCSVRLLNNKRWIININRWIPLILGSLVYLFFRKDEYLFIVEQRVPVFGMIRRTLFVDYFPSSIMGVFFLYHLTDLLWAYAFTWAVLAAARNKKYAVLLCCVYCTFAEFLQLWPFLRATFDWWDIVCQLIGVFLANTGYCFLLSNNSEGS